MAAWRGRGGILQAVWSRWTGGGADRPEAPDADGWIPVGRVEDFAGGRLVDVAVGERWVVVGRSAAGWFAVDAVCPHAGGDFAKGHVEGDAIVCPVHGWRFAVATGRCEIGDHAVDTHTVRIVGDAVQVRAG